MCSFRATLLEKRDLHILHSNILIPEMNSIKIVSTLKKVLVKMMAKITVACVIFHILNNDNDTKHVE